MKKLVHALVAVIVLAGLIVGCAVPQSTPTPEKAFKWPEMLVTVSGAETSPGYYVPLAWTPLHEKATAVKWRVIGAASSAERTQLLRDGSANFYYNSLTASGTENVEARYGLATRGGGPLDLRIALQGFIFPLGVVTRGDSPIKTIYDIKPGTTFGVPVGIATFVDYYYAYRAWLNMSERELIMVPFGNYRAAETALAEGKIDLFFCQPTSAFALEMAGGPHGIRFLDWPEKDVEGEKRFREVVSTVTFSTVNRGVKEGRGVRMHINPWNAYTLRDTDPELVYRLVKWLDENSNAIKGLCAECEDLTLKVLRESLNTTFMPVHEGTIRYLKEKGLWTAADDARQEYNVRLVNWYIKAYAEAIKIADEKGVKVDPTNKAWLEFWTNYQKEIGIPHMTVMTNEEIKAGLAKLKK